MTFGAARYGMKQFLGRKRFCQIINRAGFDGFNREFGRRVGREHEHWQIGYCLVNYF